MAVEAQALTPGKTTREQIQDFLAQKRIAVVGVSRNARDFTRSLFSEFRTRGYDVVPVNPGIAELDGLKCHSSVKEIDPPVSAVLLLTTPEITERVVDDCIETGVKSVWMYRASGRGAVSGAAVTACRQHGVGVVAGECPFMYFPKTGFPHRVHGFVRKILGTYAK